MTFGSLFSGVGGFDLGFERAGMTCAWQCEIEPNARKVLAHHWPNVPQYNDVKEIGQHNLRPVDVICGGFPCQDLSVAGKRSGLAGDRSGLWFEFRRILEELRPGCVVIENVPGLLSSNGGRDFAVLLRGLVELGYGVAWRVCDAQYHGLAQRRKRVFIVGSLADGRAAEILFESESLSWHTQPRRATGQRTASAFKIRSGNDCNGNTGGRGYLESESAFTVGPDTQYLAQQIDAVQDVAGALGALGAHKSGGWGNDLDNQGAYIPEYTWALQERDAKGADSDTKQGHLLAIPIQEIGKRQSGTPMNGVGYGKVGDPMYTLQAGAEHGDAMLGRAVSENQRGEVLETDYAHQLTTGGGKPGQGYPAVRIGVGVRRLTPVECARLQGFSDDHCSMLSDSAQYRAYGNAVAVPVAQWIGNRIMETR